MNVGYKVFQNYLNYKRICTVEVQYVEILKKGPISKYYKDCNYKVLPDVHIDQVLDKFYEVTYM